MRAVAIAAPPSSVRVITNANVAVSATTYSTNAVERSGTTEARPAGDGDSDQPVVRRDRVLEKRTALGAAAGQIAARRLDDGDGLAEGLARIGAASHRQQGVAERRQRRRERRLHVREPRDVDRFLRDC